MKNALRKPIGQASAGLLALLLLAAPASAQDTPVTGGTLTVANDT